MTVENLKFLQLGILCLVWEFFLGNLFK